MEKASPWCNSMPLDISLVCLFFCLFYSGSWTWEQAVAQQVRVLMLSQLVTVDRSNKAVPLRNI